MGGRPDAEAIAVDDTDRQILEELLVEGRMSIADLAQRVHISRANAYTRLKRLRDEGVIRRFTVDIDPSSLGLGVALIVLLSLESTRRGLDEVTAALRAMPEVDLAAIITGEYDVLVFARVGDMNELRRFIVERMQSIPSVRSTVTSVILEEVRKRPYAGDPDPHRV
ncbi:MAG: Lrp/AsnC family transcriptional regulator [Actinomycetota bacterium]|nr:Lrp/AsnC family transcriptional regulator [Actinomycetota bacterium]